MKWYYEKDRQQCGPVEESELKARFDSGEIKASNLVWCQDMKDWATYGSVFALHPGGGTTAAAPASISARAVSGTGGQSSNAELRAQARQALSGSWGMAVLAVFLWQVVQGASGMVPLVQLAIGGAMMLGLYAFFTELHRGAPADVGVLFQGFSQFGQALGIYLLTTLIVVAVSIIASLPGAAWMFFTVDQAGSIDPIEEPVFWLALAAIVVPVMIASTWMYLRYALVYFIAREEPGLGVFGTMRESVSMMEGRKMKLFLLGLSFIGWHLLGAMAFFIGLLWSSAYMFAAFAAFYDDLKEG